MCVSLAAALILACAPTPQDQAAALQAAYDEAVAASPTPKGMAAQQAYWLDDLDTYYTDPEDRAEAVASRIDDLKRMAERDRRVREVIVRGGVGELSERCVEIDLKGCSVPAGGFINGPYPQPLFWQMQDGYTDEDGISARLVLLSDAGFAGIGPIRPIAWATGGVTYEAPVVIGGGDGSPTYVAIAGRYMGTGNHNADLIFRWADDGELVQVDNWSWRDSLDQKLPEGLEIWKGVDFQYAELFAASPLWKQGDGNCCPTGGEVFLDFEIQDDVLVVTSANVRSAEAAED